MYVVDQVGFTTNNHECSSAVSNSGMQGPDGLFNDGLDLGTCQNNRAVCPIDIWISLMLNRHITDCMDLQSSPSIFLTWHPSLTSSGPQQAVIASGLGALYVADHYNTTYLHQAQVSLDATIHSSLTYDDVLKESCDDVQLGGSVCDKDQVRDLIRWPTRPVVVMLTPSPSPHRECSR